MLVAVFEQDGSQYGTVYAVRTDHMDRPVFATDAAGTKVWEVRYLPFGGVQTVVGAPIDLGFPGQWFQGETGLYQNWMRDYDPTTGSTLQPDRLGLVDGPNVYHYALANPMRYVDPRGELVGPIIRGGIELGKLCAKSSACRKIITGGNKPTPKPLPAPFPLPPRGDNSTNLDPEADRTYPWPQKPKRGWRCTCRADANQNIPGNCPNFAFGSATGPDLQSTKQEAKRIAIHKLAQQPKHVGCKCVGPGGRRVAP